MQALTIWPSASESSARPHLGLELCPCSSSAKWGERRKRLNLGHISSNGLLYISSCFRVSRSGATRKNRSRGLGAAFALTLSFEEPIKNVAEQELEQLSGFSDNKDGFAENDDVNNGGNNENDDDDDDDDGQKGHGEKVRNGKIPRVDVRKLAFKLHSAKTADDVEEVLKDKGNLLPLQVYSTIIKGFGKDKRIESAMALFHWLKRKSKESDSSIRPNLFIYNNLLGAMKQSQHFNHLDEVINDMSMEGIHPNVVTFNSLMGVYIEQGREADALQLFTEMPTRGVSPSAASYSTALFAYRRLEDGFGALAFFVEIRNKYQKGEIGKNKDEDWDHEFPKLENFIIRICYQVMRRWLVKSQNLSTEILTLLKEMDNAGLRPIREEYERLMWACTREEHCIVAKELYMRIRESNTEISLSICNHIIWLMGKAKKWWAALEIYEDLLDKGPKPNNMSYELVVSHFNILLNAARKKGIWRWGVRLLNKMEEKGLKPGSREWNSVLVACSKASETSSAIEIFKRMVENGEKPTVISYGALLSALEKGKLYDEAHKVWKHMIKVGVEPNLYAYTIMASIYAGQSKFENVESIIEEMIKVKIDPTVVTFNAIISGCARNNLGGAAYEWFQRMKTYNVNPNEVTYEGVIGALANDGKPRLAYELHVRAINEGFELSAKAYDAVIRASEIYGATIDVAMMGSRPMERKKKVVIRKDLSEFCDFAGVPRRSRVFDRSELYVSKNEDLHR